MSAHSIIAMSAAGIWGKPDGCTGYPLMAQLYPELESTPEALEGEASHEIGQGLIENCARGIRDGKPEQYIGRTASNGEVFTEEMFEGAKLYADDVDFIMRERAVFGGPHLGVERKIIAKSIHELSFGTCDCFLFDQRTGQLFIWDYKFGFEVVEAFENWQAMNYCAGIFEELHVNGLLDQVTTVHIRIVQPRAFHREGSIREWKVNGADLRGYFNQLRYNAHKALGPDAEFKTGPHCKHCSGRHACPAALTAGVRLFEAATQPVPVELSPEALGYQLTLIKRARKQLEYLESGYEEQVDGLVKSGKVVPGWGVAPTFGHEKWIKPYKEVIAMGQMMGGHNLAKEKLKTPNEARKLGIDESVIAEYSTKPRTGLTIVPDNGNKAKQVFSQ